MDRQTADRVGANANPEPPGLFVPSEKPKFREIRDNAVHARLALLRPLRNLGQR